MSIGEDLKIQKGKRKNLKGGEFMAKEKSILNSGTGDDILGVAKKGAKAAVGLAVFGVALGVAKGAFGE